MSKYEIELGGRILSFELGKYARQADGATLVQYGESSVLVTAVTRKEPETEKDFFPLLVDYQEKTFAAGKIPGGFFKREGRPTEKETLTCRLIDRPIRPLFPKGFKHDTQIVATVVSADDDNDPDVIAINGTSMALSISCIPFLGPIGAVRVGRLDGELIANPTWEQLASSDINLVVAGSAEAVIMVEGGSRFLSEAEMVDAIMFGHEQLQPIIELQLKAVEDLKPQKLEFTAPEIDPELTNTINSQFQSKMNQALTIPKKLERYRAMDQLRDEVIESIIGEEEDADKKKMVKAILEDLEKSIVRKMAIEEGRRIDARAFDEVRPITCEIAVLPRAHGSAVFTRGETQVMVATTLGTADDEQIIEALTEEHTKKFMLHYNFPPFSVAEVRPIRGPSRRDIGHGALAERSLSAVMPNSDDFLYTVRVVSDVLESNGSSSMATVCGGTLSLMDAGVPITAPVAGIAMGLIKEGDDIAIITDILGDEDHMGDMDFKVTGTDKGVSALQMDIKITGIDREILSRALEQARVARLHVLSKMAEVINEPRKELSPYAPRFLTIKIRPERIKDVIGPGGRIIKGIVADTGAKIDVEDDGTVRIASSDIKAAEMALEIIKSLTQEAEIGKTYKGKVKKIMDFGAFVEILPGTEGLVHISHFSHDRINKVTDVVQEGDDLDVVVLDIDRDGKIRLSHKELLPSSNRSGESSEQRRDNPSGGRHDRNWGDRDKRRNKRNDFHDKKKR
jgi:polyribonucleotide nucleotidyltransferase